jgi:periplasmic copper chaperone A
MRRVALALLAALGSATAGAEVTVANAWLRPASAGQKEAQLYVDIKATEATKLVGARTPVAKRTELVLLDPPQPETGKLRVVDEIPVPANAETRLAYLGSHVRLLDVTRALPPGKRIPVELTFADATGRREVVATDALVRGLVARRPDGTEIKAK